MKKSLLFTVALACFTTAAWAQINVTGSGTGVQTLDAQPPVAEWCTISIAGGGGDWTTLAQLEAGRPAISALTDQVQADGATTQHGRAYWYQGFIYTRPTGNAATALAAKLVNGTGASLTGLTVEYDRLSGGTVSEELPGHHVYWSFTGDAGSWGTEISNFSGTNSAEHVSAALDFSANPWPAGANLYILWMDDNNNGSTDSYIGIDNFLATPIGGGELTVVVRPGSTNVLQCSTLTLHASVFGGTPSYTYQWMKDGADLANQTGPDLLLENIQDDAAGSYTIRILDSFPGNPGFVVSDPPVVISVTPNTAVPTMVSAIGTPDFYHVTVSFSKPIAIGGPGALVIEPVSGGTVLAVSDAVVQNGTNVILTTTDPRTKKYRVVAQAGGVTDACNGSAVAAGSNVEILDEVTLLTWSGLWRYNQDGTAQGADWNTTNFPAESTWPEGAGVLDAKSTPRNTIAGLAVGTQLSLTSPNWNGGTGDIPSYYFRAHVNWPVNANPDESLVLIRKCFDDYGIVYLNGHEVYRDTQVTATYEPYDQYINATVGDAAISAYIPISGTYFQDGDNVISVYLKQGGATSSDITMGLEVSTVISNWFVGGPLTVTGVTPSSANLAQCATLTLTAAVQGGTRPWTYQWRRNGAVLSDGGNVSGATSKTLVVANVFPGEDNGNYQLFVSDSVGGTANSAIIPVTVTAETAPAILSAVGHTDLHTIVVAFDKPITIASATGADFLVRSVDGTGDLTITGSYVTNSSQVVLTSTDAREAKNYDVVVQGSGVTATCSHLAAQNGSLAHLTSQVLIFGLDVNNTWQYNEAGQDLSAAGWLVNSYDDHGAGWATGDAVMDGKSTPRTTVSGQTVRTQLSLTNAAFPTTAAVIPTYYFRKHFTPPVPLANMTLSCRTFFDDWGIIYLNGQEAYRNTNIVATNELFSTYLERGTVGDANFSPVIPLPQTNVFGGDNVIAVYLKQGTPGSSDITMGLELIAEITQFPPSGPRITITPISATQARVQWAPAGGTLEQSTTLKAGSWTSAGVANGGNITINSGFKFYRVAP